MSSQSDELRAWAEAHRAYVDAADVLLAKDRHGSHDLDVVEALAARLVRGLKTYRASRGEPSIERS